MMMLDKLNYDLESLIEFFGKKIRYFMGWPWVQIQFSRFLAKKITQSGSSIDFWDNLWSFGLILTKKVEFWKSFTFHAPLEIHDLID